MGHRLAVGDREGRVRGGVINDMHMCGCVLQCTVCVQVRVCVCVVLRLDAVEVWYMYIHICTV